MVFLVCGGGVGVVGSGGGGGVWLSSGLEVTSFPHLCFPTLPILWQLQSAPPFLHWSFRWITANKNPVLCVLKNKNENKLWLYIQPALISPAAGSLVAFYDWILHSPPYFFLVLWTGEPRLEASVLSDEPPCVRGLSPHSWPDACGNCDSRSRELALPNSLQVVSSLSQGKVWIFPCIWQLLIEILEFDIEKIIVAGVHSCFNCRWI